MDNAVLNRLKMNQSGRVIWIDNLRSFITVLVVAHHSSLAYTTFAKSNPLAYIRSSAPIVDLHRWVGLDIFENFNDVFFMSLMFFIGGIYLVKSIRKKGVLVFIRDRFYRLFLPFSITISSFILVAYYPAYHIMHREGGLIDFLHDFIYIEGWPPGPPWFIWVLFLFNLLFALISRPTIPLIIKAGNFVQELKSKPFTLAVLFFIIAWISYVPASWIMGPYTWTGFGPFVFQKSRFVLYFVFFILGSIIGSQNPETGLFSEDSAFVKKWFYFLGCCILFYCMLIAIEFYFPNGTGINGLGKWGDKIIYSSVYTLSTCFSCLAFLTFFQKFANRSGAIWNSLSENAYCIYLFHYIFVLWSQYILLNISLPAWIKFGIVFIFSLMASWRISILFRRIPIVKAYV